MIFGGNPGLPGIFCKCRRSGPERLLIILAASPIDIGAKLRVQKWSWAVVVGCGVGMFAGSPASSQLSALQIPASPAQATVAPNREFLTRNCVACHNQRLKAAGWRWTTSTCRRLARTPAMWEKVVRKLRTGAMPPAGRPRPDAAEALAFVASLERRSIARRRPARIRADRPPPSEPRRVHQRDPRSARPRHRRSRAAAGRRCGRERVRQQRRCPVGVARAAGALHVGGAARVSRLARRTSAGQARRSRPTTFPGCWSRTAA